jgi:8-amino-7-oxononanoate synthase
LAHLVAAPEALIARSTLHAMVDVIGVLAAGGTAVVDEGAYPIAQWSAAAASIRDVERRTFRHHDGEHAAAECRRARPPVVLVTDGWCSSCSRPAPFAALDTAARRVGGLVVVDDSLAIGMLGRRDAAHPMGVGGGGSLAWARADTARVVVVASTAKALGAPLSFVAGSRDVVRAVSRRGMTGVHASGPTAADRAALRAALDAGACGDLDRARQRVAMTTHDVRRRLRGCGLRPVGLPFPLVLAETPIDAGDLADAVSRRGCHVLALQRRCGLGTAGLLGLAIRADHRESDLNRLEHALHEILADAEPIGHAV